MPHKRRSRSPQCHHTQFRLYHRKPRFWHFFVIGLCLVLSIAACRQGNLPDGSSSDPGSSSTVTQTETAPEINLSQPLAPVDEVPIPELPEWIEQITPTNTATNLAQIRVNFTDPLISVQQLDDPSQQAILKKFKLTPEVPGQFRFLTPRMVGFAPEQALPTAARFQITLQEGLGDLSGHQLDSDLTWSFNTPAIEITNFPSIDRRWQDGSEPVDIKPVFELTSNVELNLASLKEHLSMVATGSQQAGNQRTIGLNVALENEAATGPYGSVYLAPQAKFDPSLWTWTYTFEPRQTLDKATNYALEITPGLKSAWGNVVSDRTFSAQVTTYSPLAFNGLGYTNQPNAGGAYGRFIKGSGQLTFNNGLDQESVLEAITIEPAPKETVPAVRSYSGNPQVNFNPWAFEPATTYTVTVDGSLKDQFGQSLGESVTLQYDTGDVAANFWAPSDLHIFPSSTDLRLNVSGVNLPENSYKAAYRPVQPTDLVYKKSAYPSSDGNNFLPDERTWASYPIAGETNKAVEVAIPLKEQLGRDTGLLAYGVQAVTNEYSNDEGTQRRKDEYYGLVQLTNLGVFAQWFPQSGVVQVNHLDDGSAAVGTTVEVYESKLYSDEPRTTPTPCATGTTNAAGTWEPTVADLRQCMAEQSKSDSSFTDAPELLTIVREGSDWAFIHTLAYDGAYSYGFYGGWESNQPQSRGTIFSDRSLYKPGEEAWFTGNVYVLTNGQLRPTPNTNYNVVLEDPNGDTIDLGSHLTGDYSTFAFKWDIPANQSLGFYTIRASSGEDVVLSGEFRIAEFKPPNFKVDLALDRTVAQVDDTIEATTDSQYLFGAPVQGGEASYYVTRQPTDFQPEGWEKFAFGRRWFWPEERPTVSSDVLQVTTALDSSGKGSQTVRVDQDVAYPMAYRVDADVTDVSNLSVSDSQIFTALPSDRLIGLDHNFVADAGKEFPVDVIVTDPDGKALKGQQVTLELQQMIYSSVTQVRAGSQTAKNQVEYKTVDSQTVRSRDTSTTVNLTPSESGAYRIRANFSNAPKGNRGDSTATDTQIWATGPTPAYWGGRYTNNRLELKLDKDEYKPGETATVLIQSPYEEAELHFSVVRHDVIYKSVTKVAGGAPQVQFTVTPEMVPNAAIEAVLVRQGEPLSQTEPGSLDKLVRIGFAPFFTDLGDRYLNLDITPQAEELAPGTKQTVDLQLKDNAGKPIKGQFTVMAVNEAVLQLTGYRLPDLVDIVYAEQPISTRFKDNRPDVVLQPLVSPLAKGWGYGGGLSAGTASTRIRDKFEPIAYFNGAVETDDQGRAQVSFTLPDNLTTWRVMAVATDGNLHFGQADTTFLTTQPLITNPILPQFARPGDRFQAGISVTNTTDQRDDLTITGRLEGALAFSDSSDASRQQLNTKTPEGTEAHRFTVTANQPGDATVQFTSEGSQLSTPLADGFSVPLPIEPYSVTEQVIEIGATADQVTIPINVDEKVIETAGGLDLTLASTIIPELAAPARRVFEEDTLPLLEPVASQLAIASSLQIFSQQYGQIFEDFNPPEQATQALEQLQSMQQADGGFSFWPRSDYSSVWTTPYAAQAIAQAQAAGFPVDATLVQSLKTFLSNALTDPGDYCDSGVCQAVIRLDALLALDALGDRRTEFLPTIYDKWRDFDDVERLKLSRYLNHFPDWSQEANATAAQLQQLLYQTGRSATVNVPQEWWWLNSETELQAQALRLFSDRQVSLALENEDFRDRLIQGLLNLRRDGTWPTTYDNAEALMALVDYSQTLGPPPNFTAQADLAGTTLTSAQFQGYQPSSTTADIPMADLPKGQNDLVLSKTGPGVLHYLAAYTYRLDGEVPGRMNGLRVTRTVHPVNADNVTDAIETMALTPKDKVVKLDAAQVFDIGLEIITDHPVDHVVITDPLPAGLEAVDTNFQTTTDYFQPQTDSWQIRYQTIYKDKVQAYGDRLPAGVYSLHYLVRSVTSGTFQWPGAEAHLQYAPEEFGRSASAILMIE
ncbi:MAG: alpha-2-macroglobulin family protein [Merismopedia sp. SIO2A8]|nr:alpha-2-macroglobulin family protein [Merismopedia sp. SIO2A8]